MTVSSRLLVLLNVVACGGGTQLQEPSSKIEVVAPAPAKPNHSPLVAPRASEDDLLAYTPNLYSLVFHVSIAKLRISEFYVQHESRILGKVAARRQAVIAACKFDPVMDMEGVSLGLMFPTNAVLVVSTKLGSTRIEDCIRAMGGTVTNGRYEVGDWHANAYWPTPNVVLLSDRKTSVDLKNELLTGTVLDSPVLMEVLGQADRSATLWGGGTIPGQLSSMMPGGGPDGLVVRGSLWAGLDATIELFFDDEEGAKATQSMIDLALQGDVDPSAPMYELLEAVEVQQMGAAILLDVQLSPELTESLLEEVR